MSDTATFVPPEQFDEYRILRSLGSGTMGTVYLGHDLSLDRKVAIKFIAAANPSPRAKDRLLREARAIARLSHPNVVSIYRIGEVDGRPYLVSEYVSGRTLELPLPMPLTTTSLLQIGRGLCSGLVAAHGAGVLHRDIKPANVIITKDGQPKLLDFGLAKLELSALSQTDLGATDSASVQDSSAQEASLQPDSANQELTTSGAILGTPSYLAPELWEGALASERSDLYSLGALLYKLGAGRSPFLAASLAELRHLALCATPDPLAERARTLDPRLCNLIDRCLAREPEKRPASAADLLVEMDSLVEALRAEETPKSSGLWSVRFKTRFFSSPVANLLWAVLWLCGLVGVGVFAHSVLRPKPNVLGREETGIRKTVAVLGFKGLREDREAAWYGVALSELMSAELSAGESLRMIPGESVARMKSELGLKEADGYAPDTLSQIRKNLGSDIVVFGTYLAMGQGGDGQLRWTVKVQQTANGEVVTTATESGQRSQLMELTTKLGSTLRNRLGYADLSGEAKLGLAASKPKSPEVAQLYAEGLDRLRRFEPKAAQELLERAVAKEPDYPLTHAALGAAYKALGSQHKAKEAVRRANERAGGLPQKDRLLVEARYRTSIGEYDKAVEIHRALVALFPDNVDLGLQLAEAQMAASRPRDALETAKRLRELPLPAREDPRIDLMIGQAAYSFSELTSATEALERAVAMGRAQGTPILVAKALRMQGWTAQNQGDHERGIELVEEALRLSIAVGDRYGEADANMDLSGRYWLGQGEQALASLERAAQIYLEVGNGDEAAATGVNAANMLLRKGQLRLARLRLDGSLLWGREQGRYEMIGSALILLGWIDTLEGHLTEAHVHLQEAVKIFSEMGDQILLAWAWFHEGEVLLEEGRLDEAQKAHEEALAIRKGIGAEIFVSESEAAMATLLEIRGQRDQAEALVRKALATAVKRRAKENEAHANALLGYVLVQKSQGKAPSKESVNEAEKALVHAMAWTKKGFSLVVRAQVAIFAGRVHKKGGSPEAVQATRGELQDCLGLVESAGMVGFAKEIRNLLGWFEARSKGRKDRAMQ